MSWITILYAMMAALSVTLAGIYLVAWLMQRDNWAYLVFVVVSLSFIGVAATELWMLRAQTPQEYGIALRWFQVPIWTGFCAFVVLVYLRLRPRFLWVGALALGLRTVALVANFGPAPSVNYTELTGIKLVMLLGEPVTTVTGIPNPWMLTAQASLVLLVLFILDGGISAWRREEDLRAPYLAIALLVVVVLGTVESGLVFWGFVQWPILITPLLLLISIAMGAELSFGLLRAARAERDVQTKDAALGLSEQRLSLAAEAADVGFWSLQVPTGEVWATEKTRELFALDHDRDLRLADFVERVHAHDRGGLARLIEEAVASNDRLRSEFRVVDSDGGVRWLAGLGRCVGKVADGPMTLMGVSVDITARKALLDRARRQRVRLESESRMETLSELSAFVAHELNQPLAMILANAEAAQGLLAKAKPNLTEVREILADIISADRRASEVIWHVRALLERGEPQRDEMLLEDAVRRVLRLLGNEIDEHGVSVELGLASDLPPVQADRILIEQVLFNLLNNACDAVTDNPPGERRVAIRTRLYGGTIMIEVTDNGCGLADPDIVFDPFYSTKPRGLGMGLAIVRSIVNGHGGRVWAQSAPGGGATFLISLPKDAAPS